MSTHILAEVLTRLKLLTGANTDAELSRALSVSPQTLSSWKVRESIPYSLCIDIAKKHACSLDWLLLGQAEHNAAPSDVGWECDMLERLRTLSHSDRSPGHPAVHQGQTAHPAVGTATERARRRNQWLTPTAPALDEFAWVECIQPDHDLEADGDHHHSGHECRHAPGQQRHQ